MLTTAFSNRLAILKFMKRLNATLILLFALPSLSAVAESKRIAVYPLTQAYWDVRYGDSLSHIAASLLPNNPNLQQQLMQDIIKMNPDVFVDKDANQMLAERRIWLPNTMNQADTKVDPGEYTVESFSWGNVKRRK